MSETQSAFGVGAATITQKVTATTGVGSFIGFIAKIDVIAWGGLVIAALGLAIQLYFAWARNRREKVEHKLRKAEYELRIQKLKGDCDVKQD
ncbi:holin [Acinetobacter baumannii]|uniref:holin n=1 Tax=Acinetobacter baumannii TaxID=470 RepID=UPI0013B9C8FA|nr:holin [Acinetobacter baumannii]EKV4682677.1 holin [Acinetobacter baumannii]EKV7986973.1 holin [Acinetobacter baumannii]EKW5932146.1 holin [Acinetobacter baumannii]EKX6547349.1 holin [Acinetobacter baumannii]ELB3493666.1 holin [Acinetobacter baumannii]